MATATDAVNAAFNKYLNRNAGTTGLDYWAPEWEKNKASSNRQWHEYSTSRGSS